MKLCNNCEKRDTCTELCEKAEKYISKDHVNRREVLATPIKPDKTTLEHAQMIRSLTTEAIPYRFLSQTERQCLKLYYVEGLTYREIAFRLSNQYRQLSSSKVKYRIHAAKLKILTRNYLEKGSTHFF